MPNLARYEKNSSSKICSKLKSMGKWLSRLQVKFQLLEKEIIGLIPVKLFSKNVLLRLCLNSPNFFYYAVTLVWIFSIFGFFSKGQQTKLNHDIQEIWQNSGWTT